MSEAARLNPFNRRADAMEKATRRFPQRSINRPPLRSRLCVTADNGIANNSWHQRSRSVLRTCRYRGARPHAYALTPVSDNNRTFIPDDNLPSPDDAWAIQSVPRLNGCTMRCNPSNVDKHVPAGREKAGRGQADTQRDHLYFQGR